MSKEIVCHEFPAIGKFRVRLVKADLKEPVMLDVREYVGNPSGAPVRGASGAPLQGVNGGSSKSLSKDGFEGFSRRGIKLGSVEAMKGLRDSLTIAINMLEVSENAK
jgi:hypothetical protein